MRDYTDTELARKIVKHDLLIRAAQIGMKKDGLHDSLFFAFFLLTSVILWGGNSLLIYQGDKLGTHPVYILMAVAAFSMVVLPASFRVTNFFLKRNIAKDRKEMIRHLSHDHTKSIILDDFRMTIAEFVVRVLNRPVMEQFRIILQEQKADIRKREEIREIEMTA